MLAAFLDFKADAKTGTVLAYGSPAAAVGKADPEQAADGAPEEAPVGTESDMGTAGPRVNRNARFSNQGDSQCQS